MLLSVVVAVVAWDEMVAVVAWDEMVAVVAWDESLNKFMIFYTQFH